MMVSRLFFKPSFRERKNTFLRHLHSIQAIGSSQIPSAFFNPPNKTERPNLPRSLQPHAQDLQLLSQGSCCCFHPPLLLWESTGSWYLSREREFCVSASLRTDTTHHFQRWITSIRGNTMNYGTRKSSWKMLYGQKFLSAQLYPSGLVLHDL